MRDEQTGPSVAEFADYALEEEIGSSARGTLYRAKKEGRTLALKVLGRDVEADRATLSRLARGSSTQIRHPNLPVLENVRLAAQALGRDNFKFWRHYQHFGQYEERALEILDQVDLAGQAHLLARVLPHGGKRKLELAILLAADPELLLLDEPTAGMAREEIPRLMDVIQQIRQPGDKTLMLVEHKMDLVMNVSDRITVMHQGQILAEGTPSEIAANQTVQSAYLGQLYGDLSEVT